MKLKSIFNDRHLELSIVLKWVPLVFYLCILFIFWENIPVYDDYDIVLGSLNRYITTDSFYQNLSQMINGQSNEHKIFYNKILNVFMVTILGKVDFRFLMLTGNLAIVGIFILFNKQKKYLITKIDDSKVSRNFVLLIFSLLFFNIQYYDSMLWGAPSNQYHGVLFFSILYFYFLFRSGGSNYYLAAFFGVLAAYTHGNGLVCLFSSIIMLVFLNDRKKLIFVVILTALTLFIYFYHYRFNPNPNIPKPLDTLKNIPHLIISYFFLVTGSLFQFGTSKVINYTSSAIAGVLLSSLSFYLIVLKKHYQKSSFLSIIIIFIILTFLLTSLSRAGLGLSQAFASRYKVFQSIHLAVLTILIIKELNNRKYIIGLLVFAISFNAISFIKYLPKLQARQSKVKVNGACLNLENYTSKNILYPGVVNASISYSESKNLEIYSAPNYCNCSSGGISIKQINEIPKITPELIVRLEVIDISDIFDFNFKGWCAVKNYNLPAKLEKRLVLISNKKTYELSANDMIREDVSRAIDYKFDWYNSGFYTSVNRDDIEIGSYEVFIKLIDKSNQKVYFKPTGKQFEKRFELKPIKIHQKIKFLKEGNVFTVKGWAILRGEDSKSFNMKLILKSDKTLEFLDINKQIRKDVTKNYIGDNINYNESGFRVDLDMKHLLNKPYTVYIALESTKRKGVYYYSPNIQNIIR